MKTINQKIFTFAVGLLFASAIHTFAIEGLQISVQCSNVVLSWPGATGETYIVQYRQTLNPTDSWTTLADYLPAATSTNMTVFVHSNIIQHPNCGVSGSFGSMVERTSGLAGMARPSLPLVPMAIPTNGSGNGIPLALYPPGLDMSGFVILDPATRESVNGADYSMISDFASSDLLFDEPESDNATQEPDTGFYRVVRDGVHIYGMTNGMVLSGEVQLPIEFAVGSTDEIVGVTFYDQNNFPIIGASAQANAGGGWTLDWNTPMSFNGDYNIYAELDFASDDPVVSAPVTVTINNTISFPNYFSRVFGDQMWIYAQTIPNANYRIDMYGQNTNYLGYFYGSADGGGTISFLWSLSGLTDTNFYGVFSITSSSQSAQQNASIAGSENHFTNSSPDFQELNTGDPATNEAASLANNSSSSASQLWVKEGKWTPNNNWVVAYASLTGDGSVDRSAKWMIVGGAGSPAEDYGVLGTLDEYGLTGNLSPGNNAENGDVFTLQDQSSRSNLLNYFADHRYENFYFFGHGNNAAISAYNSSLTAITRDQIAAALANVPLNYQIQHAAEHPYRFIWIDACDTGKANFCEAFGIPAITVSTNFFKAAGVESRAFIGFTKPTGFDPSNSSSDPNGWQNRSTMTGTFLSAWLSGSYDLQTIVANAKNGFGEWGYKMDPSAIIYGAYDLKRYTFTRP